MCRVKARCISLSLSHPQPGNRKGKGRRPPGDVRAPAPPFQSRLRGILEPLGLVRLQPALDRTRPVTSLSIKWLWWHHLRGRRVGHQHTRSTDRSTMATQPRCGGGCLTALLLALCLAGLCPWAAGLRVLLLPLPDTGQCRQMVAVGRELETRGHQVILFVPSYFRARRCTEPLAVGGADIEVRIFDMAEEEADVIEDKLEKLGDESMRGGTGLLGGSGPARDLVRDICSSYMEARDDLDELRREGRVDVVVVDGSSSAHCLTLLPAYLGAPFVALASFIDPFDSAIPIPTSFYPAPLSALPGNMALFQRISNFLSYASSAGGGELWGGFHQGNTLGERVSRLDQHQLIKKALLYLENSDYIIDYPKATFPNFLQVGGLTTLPAKPLPGPLAKFFDSGADTGVVIVSLGPQVFTPNKNLEDKLLAVFRKMNLRVLLRLNASRSVNKIKNVQPVSWFPQNDALGHPNTKLFISHCGKNSFFEALFHGVPLLCCNFAGSDVLGTSLRVAEYGVGLSLDLLTATPDAIEVAVNTLLTDKAYARRMKAASKLFHSRGLGPAKRAANAIEHVLKHGAGYLRPRSVEMTFFQYAGLDVAMALFLVVFGLVGLLAGIIVNHTIPIAFKAKVKKDDGTKSEESSTVEKTAPPTRPISPYSQIIMYACLALVILFYIFV